MGDRTSKWATTAAIAVVGLVSAGCGQDNPGEPLGKARTLVGRSDVVNVHVYCVERSGASYTPCSLLLNYRRLPNLSEMERAWLDVARDAAKLGAFEDGGVRWKFTPVVVAVETRDGSQYPNYGWYCPNRDAGHSRTTITEAMDARNPGVAGGIRSANRARAEGCLFRVYPR